MTRRRMVGGFDTITAALDYAADSDQAVRFFSALGQPGVILTYRELRERALAAGRRLSGIGMSRGTRVAIVADTGPDFLAIFYGCQYAGLVPCPMPYMTYVGGMDAYRARIESLIRAADARILCVPDAIKTLADLAAAGNGVLSLGFDEFAAMDDSATVAPFRADEIAYIQFSSGSTSRPKGIPVTQSAICANANAILRFGMNLTDDDRAFSWLPFYHDMGLVGFSIAPLFGQCPVDYIAPSAFARRPNLWVELMSRQRSTITYAPTFGYRFAAQRFDRQKAIDLSCLRIAGIGGDLIRADVLDEFAATMTVAGFQRSAFRPSYGMAEATLAITFADSLSTDPVDSLAMRESGVAVSARQPSPSDEVRQFVVCGKVIPDHELIVAGPDDQPVPERHVGRILVRGPSIMRGYDHAPALTSEVMRPNGFMDTGDLGYASAMIWS